MKTLILSIATTAISLIAILALTETSLRLMGYEPWTYGNLDRNEPVMIEFDPVLGWKNQMGEYIIPPYSADTGDINVSIVAPFVRSTSAEPITATQQLVFVGGSFTHGLAISDHETFPWKVQTALPELSVLNYGVSGYSAYQSLLVLEQELQSMPSPAVVLYGFYDHHLFRNVAPAAWLKSLTTLKNRAHIDLPYASFDRENGFQRHKPERYLALPLREHLATATFIESSVMQFVTRERSRGWKKEAVMAQVLREMHDVSQKHGARFVTVLLHAQAKNEQAIKNLLDQNDIAYLDCLNESGPEFRVKGEGHPNGKRNSLWANCIIKGLQPLL